MSNDGRFGDPIRLGAMKPSTAILLLESLSIGSNRMLFSDNRGRPAADEVMRLYKEVAETLGLSREIAVRLADRSSSILDVLKCLESDYAGDVEVRFEAHENNGFRPLKGSLVVDLSGRTYPLLPVEISSEAEEAISRLAWSEQREQRAKSVAGVFDERMRSVLPLLRSAAGLDAEFFVEATLTADLQCDARLVGYDEAREAVEVHFAGQFANRSDRCTVRRFVATDFDEDRYVVSAQVVVPLDSVDDVSDLKIDLRRAPVMVPRP